MKYAQTLKRGTSCGFAGQPTPDRLRRYAEAGIEALEVSYPCADELINSVSIVNRLNEQYGIEYWSLHLPFHGKYDISQLDDARRDWAITNNEELIREGSKYGIKIAILHPSGEPIGDEERPERFRRSREAIIYLADVCKTVGMRLAVENMPRTLLCNRSAEMVELLTGTSADVVYDMNHSSFENNIDFIRALAKGGLKIISTHICDYDGGPERHVLPGYGTNDWNGILATLEEIGYDGPLLYEAFQPKDSPVAYTFELLAENQRKLANGEL